MGKDFMLIVVLKVVMCGVIIFKVFDDKIRQLNKYIFMVYFGEVGDIGQLLQCLCIFFGSMLIEFYSLVC